MGAPVTLVDPDGVYTPVGGGGGGLTDAQLRATPVPVSGTVTTGGLTDVQLRATPVPVSGTVTATGPLTDTQLRATPVPVSGTVTATGPLTDTQLRATPVPVAGTVATGGLTDTELRATAVPVSGPLTDVQIRAVALPVSGTFFQATQPVSGTFWQATQPVSGTFWQVTQPVSGPLTDAEIRATALPVSGTVTVNFGTIAGAATAAKQPALGIAGTASTDVITIQGIASMTPLLVNGSGVTQPVSAASLPLPTGAATETSVAAAATSLATLDDWDESDRAKVNPIVGSAGVTGGAGNTDAATQRVVIATNQAAVPVSGPQTNAEYLAANRCTVTKTSVNSSASSTQLLAANANRKSLTIVNTDANTLYIDTSGGTATTACIPILTGASWSSNGAVPVGAITAIWAADGAGAATIFEGA